MQLVSLQPQAIACSPSCAAPPHCRESSTDTHSPEIDQRRMSSSRFEGKKTHTSTSGNLNSRQSFGPTSASTHSQNQQAALNTKTQLFKVLCTRSPVRSHVEEVCSCAARPVAAYPNPGARRKLSTAALRKPCAVVRGALSAEPCSRDTGVHTFKHTLLLTARGKSRRPKETSLQP